MAAKNQYQRIVPFIVFTLALFLLFKLIQPLISVLLGSFLLSYITFPLYKKIIKRIPNKTITIILSLFIVILIILIPFTFLAFEIIGEGYYFYNSLSTNTVKGALLGIRCASDNSTVCSLLNQAEKFSLKKLSTFGLDKKLKEFLPVLEQKITDFVISIPIIISQVFLSLVISYFIIQQWENILKKIAGLLPMRTKTINRLTEEFKSIANTVIYAQLTVAIVQGITATIGFYIFGVPFPIILGLVTAFSALIPAIGTAIIWIPASLFLILSGYFTKNYWVLGKGIGMFLYGFLIISTIDNILLTKIVNTKAKVNQIIVIIGVIGGASMFGIVGIFIGPILLPLLLTYFETFKERFD
ncbi:MAG: AI-2E family transporter [archaeon]